MGDSIINVAMTERQLKFIIDKIHVDNSFRKSLEDIYEENTMELPTRAEVSS